MAFQLWVDDDSRGTSVLSESDFASLTQRRNGFEAGQTASARNVNSGLRQANLVACAIMDALSITNKSLQTARSTLATSVSEALNSRLAYIGLGGSNQVTGNVVPKENNSINLGSNENAWHHAYVTDLYLENVSLQETIAELRNDLANYKQYMKQVDYATGSLHNSDLSIGVTGNYWMQKCGNMVVCYVTGSIQSTTADVWRTILTIDKNDATLGKFKPSYTAYSNNYVPVKIGEIMSRQNSSQSGVGQGVFNVGVSSSSDTISQIELEKPYGDGYALKGFNGVIIWFTD